eukprot:jgi/Bigna1/46826/estExt_Genewise1.C_70161
MGEAKQNIPKPVSNGQKDQAITFKPVSVVDAKDITIREFFGRIASRDARLSACEVSVKKASEEAWQTPQFDEYVMVLEGKVELRYSDGSSTTVEAGSGAFLPAGMRVKWRWPGPCKYIPICLPAFSTDNCGREDEEGNNHAKTGEAMMKLTAMHESAKHPWLYHVAKKSLWEAAKQSKSGIYYPPTFVQDGKFTHATADPTKLIDVLNHFYKDVKDEYVCLRTDRVHLERGGVKVIFEKTAPVGDISAIDMGDQLFPHLLGGIPAQGVVLEEMPVMRAKDGTFLEIKGLLGEGVASRSRGFLFPGCKVLTFGLGMVVGALTAVVGMHAMCSRKKCKQ